MLHAFPPDIAVVGQRDVGEDGVLGQAAHAVRVGQHVGARSHAKVAGLGVDGAQAAVCRWFDPGDVVADGGDLPALKAGGRHQHGKIGLAAGAGERCRHVILFALGVGHAQNQHVLGQPAFVAAHDGGDAQRKTFFAQQGIAAVAGAVRPDLTRFRVMHDVLGLVAGPCDVFLPGCQRRAHSVNARHEIALRTQHVIHGTAHARHELHVHRHVGAV